MARDISDLPAADAAAASLDPLSRLAVHHGADKYGVHVYTPIYHRFFSEWRDRPVRLLEIGVGGYAFERQGGPSLRMWADYFPKGRIVGMDLFPKRLDLPERVTVVQGSQTSPEDLDRVWREHGPFDIVIDDGSHRPADVLVTFEHLFDRLAPGGLYVIEDLHCSFGPYFGGRPDGCGTVIERLGELIRDIHDREIDVYEPGRAHSRFGALIGGLHLFYNLAVIERGTNDFPSIFGFTLDHPEVQALQNTVQAQIATEASEGAYLAAAALHVAASYPEAALEIAVSGLARFPNSLVLLHAAQDWAGSLGRNEERLAFLERLNALCPDDPAYRLLTAACLADLGQSGAAEALSDKIEAGPALAVIMRLEDANPPLCWPSMQGLRACLALRAGDTGLARAAAGVAVALAPEREDLRRLAERVEATLAAIAATTSPAGSS